MSGCCGPNKKKVEKRENPQTKGETTSIVSLKKSKVMLGVALVLVAGILGGYLIAPLGIISQPVKKEFKDLAVDQQREEWIEGANIIRGKLAAEGKYDCCLENPCWYCIYKTPGHGEGAACECRQNILDGVHPCGECIGEILEGHGLPELAPYYAKAIAHKVGEEHLNHLEDIIGDLYKLE